jgi:hypothetical protein
MVNGNPENTRRMRMGEYQRRDGSFSLFKNDYKKSEKHPDFKGKGAIGGVDYEAALWKRKSQRDGTVYLSLSIKPAMEREARKQEEDAPF